MKRITIVLFVSVLFPVSATASDNNGKFSTFTVVNIMGSCATYVSARDERRHGETFKHNVHLAWIFGYITAYNMVKPNTFDISEGLDQEALMLWLENYCKKNPLESFPSAVESLTVELYPKRATQAPKK